MMKLVAIPPHVDYHIPPFKELARQPHEQIELSNRYPWNNLFQVLALSESIWTSANKESSKTVPFEQYRAIISSVIETVRIECVKTCATANDNRRDLMYDDFNASPKHSQFGAPTSYYHMMISSRISELLSRNYYKDLQVIDVSALNDTIELRKIHARWMEIASPSLASMVHDVGKTVAWLEAVSLYPFSDEAPSAERKKALDQHIVNGVKILSHRFNLLEMGIRASFVESPEKDLFLFCFRSLTQQILQTVKYHHEKMDGTGPFQLTQEKIPVAARIVAVSESFVGNLKTRLTYHSDGAPITRPACSVSESIQRLAAKPERYDQEIVAHLRVVAEPFRDFSIEDFSVLIEDNPLHAA